MAVVDELRDRATRLGIETSYEDVDGHRHDASESTLRRIIDVLTDDLVPASGVEPVIVARGGTDLDLAGATKVSVTLADGADLDVAVRHGRATLPPDVPLGCHELHADGPAGEHAITLVVPPVGMPHDDRFAGAAGLFVPAYALWEHAAPLPSFEHLGALARRLPVVGIDVLSTLPLYAAFLDDPFDPSPYAPASRLHWNEVYLDDATVPEAPRPALEELIDWRALARRRRLQLLEAAKDLDPYIEHGVAGLVARRPDVADFARFRTERPDPVDADHPPDLVRRSHLIAQYLADHQLAGIEGDGRAALALDLPVGSHLAGYETWAFPSLFAEGMFVGAPPDEFFGEGQDWGFPPQLPGAGRRSGHHLWRQLVACAGEHCSILRIDHVMAVERLWWIPDGTSPADGAYVRYPREELLAVIAAEAARSATTIVGEDLGTVPKVVTASLAAWNALGMYEEQFALQHGELHPIPERSVAGIRTHDMAPFAAVVGDEGPGVDAYLRRLERAVGHSVGLGGLLDAVLERLAASDAYLVLADIDDLIGESRPQNVPGRVVGSSWRRRLPEPTSAMLSGDVRRRLELLSNRSGSP